MAEHRTDDEVMNGEVTDGRDVQQSPDPDADRSSGGPSTADVAGAGSANQATTTDVSGTETTAPPEQRPEPQSRAPAPAADQPARPAQTNEESRTPLFAADLAESFRSRWQDIQTSFVDEPRRAVRAGRQSGRRGHAAARQDLCRRAFTARTAGASRRGHLDRGSADGSTALPVLLRSPALDLSAAGSESVSQQILRA